MAGAIGWFTWCNSDRKRTVVDVFTLPSSQELGLFSWTQSSYLEKRFQEKKGFGGFVFVYRWNLNRNDQFLIPATKHLRGERSQGLRSPSILWSRAWGGHTWAVLYTLAGRNGTEERVPNPNYLLPAKLYRHSENTEAFIFCLV